MQSVREHLERYLATGLLPPIGGGAGALCGGSVQLCAIRLARLEPNGVPDPGSGNLIVFDQVVSLTVTPEYEEGEDLSLKNGCGRPCVSHQTEPTFKRVGVSLVGCTQDAEISEMLAGGVLLTSGASVRGWGTPRSGVALSRSGVSIEAWSQHIVDDEPHPDFPYIRHLLPKTKAWKLGERVLENGIMQHPFQGIGVQNPNWFNGPGNDWPYTSDRAYEWAYDTAIPATACGAMALSAS